MPDPTPLPIGHPPTSDPLLFFIASEIQKLNISVASLDTSHQSLYKQMLGNGQPGRVQQIEAAHDALRKRVGALDRKIWYASGGLAAVAVFIKYWVSKVFGLSN